MSMFPGTSCAVSPLQGLSGGNTHIMNTPKRDLRGGGSFWLAGRLPAVKSRARPARQSYDVAMLGAGVSGALAAASLAGLGKSVVILDRRGTALGSTAASTAMIQWEIDQPLRDLVERIGESRAVAAYRSSLRGVLALRSLILNHRVDCNWADRMALTVAGTSMGQRALADELRLRNKHGFPSYWIEGRDLRSAYGIDRTAALLNAVNGELHPVKLARGLLAAAIASGMELVAPAEVTEIGTGRDGVSLQLAGGPEISAGKVIVCAGYEALPQIPHGRYRLTSTWAIATGPLDAVQLLPARPLIWEQSDPYLYMRTTHDNRIIAGGEDAEFSSPARRDALIPAKARAIMRKLKAFLPDLDGEVDYAWAGTFADSPTGLPAIGVVPGMSNVFTTLGSGGNGITFSAIAAGIARDWVMGRRHPDAKLYDFG